MVSKTATIFPCTKLKPKITQKVLWKPDMVTHTSNGSTWKDESGGSPVLGLSELE